jgi:hypothetical protein
MTGEDVRQWQYYLVGQNLLQEPYDSTVEASGTFDEATIQATREFQQKHGLLVDGWVGAKTLGQAAKEGFPLVAEDNSSIEDGPGWPPPPNFKPLTCTADRQRIFGAFQFIPAPTPSNPEGIRILGDWYGRNIVRVEIPQLIGVEGAPHDGKVEFHRLGAEQLKSMFADWDQAGLMPLVKTYAGTFCARFIRGSRQNLSNHCLPANTTIWTTEGPAAIADLKGFKGHVWSYAEGRAVPGQVTDFFSNGPKPLLKIYAHGHTLCCTPNHPCLILRKRTLPKDAWVQHKAGRGQQRALYWVEMVPAEQLKPGDRWVFIKDLPEVPITQTIDEDWAEVLGLFLGDGCVGHRRGVPEYLSFSIPDTDRIRPHAEALLTRVFGCSPKLHPNALVYYAESIFTKFLPFDHYARNKRIPSEAWAWCASARLRLLLGLLYTDGTVCCNASKTGGGTSARYCFKFSSQGLVEDVRMLMASLGFRVTRISEEAPKEGILICGVPTRSNGSWSVHGVDAFGVLEPNADALYVSRIAAASTPNHGTSNAYGYERIEPHFTHRKIQRIEYIGDADVYDIGVRETHNFLAGGAVVSNSFGTAIDLNAQWNWLGAQPALKGKIGSIRELVPLANANGLYSGIHFKGRPDGMHFELAFIK